MEYNSEELEEYLEQLDLYLANLEKLGALFLCFGYSLYIKSAQIDILEITNEDFEPPESPRQILVDGQQHILLGYVILYVVAVKRLNEKILLNSFSEEPVRLTPYKHVIESYLISVFANYQRLRAFQELTGEEVIV